jgi:hypothetical protein
MPGNSRRRFRRSRQLTALFEGGTDRGGFYFEAGGSIS